MAFDYYSLPSTKEPFDGQVIKLDADAFDYLFQNYSDGNEYKFREQLHKMDCWFHDKPYKIYMKDGWVKHIVKWLQKPEEEKDDD